MLIVVDCCSLWLFVVECCWLLIVDCGLLVFELVFADRLRLFVYLFGGCEFMVSGWLGGWWMVVGGRWLLVANCGLVVVGCWFLVVGCWLFVVVLLVVVGCRCWFAFAWFFLHAAHLVRPCPYCC